MLPLAVHNAARGIRKAQPAYASVHRSCNKTARPSPVPSLAHKRRQKSAFAAVADLLCKTLLPFAGATFIARPLKNEIPCGFADHQCSEGLPIVRFIGTKVADLFSSTRWPCPLQLHQCAVCPAVQLQILTGDESRRPGAKKCASRTKFLRITQAVGG